MEKLIYIINAIILFLIVRYEQQSHNDKTFIVSISALMTLLILNLLCGIFAQFDKKKISKHFYYSALGILVSGSLLFYF